MNQFPNYKRFNLIETYDEDLKQILNPELNFRSPAIIDLRKLEKEDQLLALGMIEYHFKFNGQSSLFPYPVYILSEVELKNVNLKIFQSEDLLPKFFRKSSYKLNNKENQILEKNYLLQKSIRNSDVKTNNAAIEKFSKDHKEMNLLEREYKFYLEILNRIV